MGRGVPATGSRKRYSVTGELLFPVRQDVQVDVAMRFDDYSDFGSTANPKLLAGWDVTEALNVHGSYNEGFRAPTLPQVLAPKKLGLVSGLYNDPLLCPMGVPMIAAGAVPTRDCRVAFNSLGGGNPALQPQKSRAYAFGVALDLPVAWSAGALSASIDYWRYTLEDRVGVIATNTIFANAPTYSDSIVRCSQADPAFESQSAGCNFGGPGDPIAYTLQTNENLGTIETDGVDMGLNWMGDLGAGSLNFEYRGTYTRSFLYKDLPTDSDLSRKGVYRGGSVVFPYSHFLQLAWRHGGWSAALQNRYRSGYQDCNAECFVAPEFFASVGGYSLWNVSGSYRFNGALSVTFHVNNLLDENPPFTNADNSNCTGCDLRYVDVMGRSYGLTLVGRFGGARAE